jgi:MerR family transcriptional regulator, redox-sensitive transcriptional activator SoxR
LEPRASDLLTIGALAARSGIAPSALRYYESVGLISAARNAANQRRYPRSTLRVVSLIRVARELGFSLDEIAAAFASLPNAAAPTVEDWERLSLAWRAGLEARISLLVELRDDLSECIGCGCLSLERCVLYNRRDKAAARGAGPRYLMGDAAASITEPPD